MRREWKVYQKLKCSPEFASASIMYREIFSCEAFQFKGLLGVQNG